MIFLYKLNYFAIFALKIQNFHNSLISLFISIEGNEKKINCFTLANKNKI